MRILPFTDESLIEALSIIHAGGVVAHATETCYGFACDISNQAAVEKLFRIKNRPTLQPVSALFESVDTAKEYVEWNERAEELAKEYLPGPLTLILPMRSDAPKKLFPNPNPSPNPTLGIRISSHPHAMLLAERFGSPLTTTSANLHGQPNPYSPDDTNQQYNNANNQPDLILDSGTLPPTPPSTVINLATDQKEMETLRQGDVKF